MAISELQLPPGVRACTHDAAGPMAQALAVRVADALREAIAVRGQATLVVSGGRSPVSFFEALAQQDLPWAQVRVSLADERWVPVNHASSNEAHNARRRVRELSKGNVQRVALAHALVVSPRLLVLDEPLSGLDPVGRKDVVDILSEYKREGGAIFFTSHVLHDVERIADRFGFIHQGELLTTRSPRDLVSERADRFIVRYQASAALDGAHAAIRDGEYEQELDEHALPAFLTRLQAADGRLMTVKPAVSLETVFFKILEGEQTAPTSGPR